MDYVAAFDWQSAQSVPDEASASGGMSWRNVLEKIFAV